MSFGSAKESASEFRNAPFIMCLADAITTCSYSQLALEDIHKSTYARASILNAVLAVEAVANTLLDYTHLSCRLVKQYDHLPTLDKFEMILSYRHPEKLFERGRKEVQAIQELIDLRNSLVHPRISKQALELCSSDGSHRNYKSKNQRHTNVLRIPDLALDWQHIHAVTALKAVDSFLTLFFIEYGGMDPEDTAKLLFPAIKLEDGRVALVVADHHWKVANQAKQTLGLGFKYILFPKAK